MNAARIFAALAPLALVAVTWPQAPRYQYTDFPFERLGNYRSIQVPLRYFDDGTYLGGAGWMDEPETNHHRRSFIASNGRVEVIPRQYGATGYPSEAIDMTPTRKVVGYDYGFDPMAVTSQTRVWTYENGIATVLPCPEGFYGYPEGIADNGDIGGWRYEGNLGQAFAYLNGVYTDLESGGRPSLCRGVDAAGNMVGNVESADGASIIPVRWKDGVRSTISELAGYARAEIQAVSKGGVVAGVIVDPSFGDGPRAFTLLGGVVTVMPDEPGQPWGMEIVDVNDRGTVLSKTYYSSVGWYMLYSGGQRHSWYDLYTPHGAYRPLQPMALNNLDEIIGGANHKDDPGEWRMFIAKPVPEPASIATLGLGLLAVAFRRRRPCPR